MSGSADLQDPAVVARLLRRHGLAGDGLPAVEMLTGGVSSLVVRVSTEQGCFVVKQALPRLAVRDDWFADVRRFATEARAGQVLAELVPGAVPAVLAVDADAHAFVMSCAAEGSRTWKQDLLAGHVEPAVARAAGALIAAVHERSPHLRELAEEFADRTHFETLRIDPYLRTVRHRHPDLAEPLEAVIDMLLRPGMCLVHGDASPKNLLIEPGGRLLLIDHEVAHWGQPAFDLAFLLNHLCLKAIARPSAARNLIAAAQDLVEAYTSEAGVAGADSGTAARVLAPLMLARVDGKSPVEYLVPEQQTIVRRLARELINKPPALNDLLARVLETALDHARAPQ